MIDKLWNLPEYIVKYRVHRMNSTNTDTEKLNNQYRLIFKDLFQELQIEWDNEKFETQIQP